LNQASPVLFPDVTYAFYAVYCRLFGIRNETVALDDHMRVRVADYAGRRGPIILANPNAPTGIALSRADITRLLAEHREVPVVIGEAYVDFGAETAIPLVRDHPNLLVVQTMSKSRGLAGLRVGYAIGQAELVEALRRVKDSFNSYPLDRLAEVGAIASLQDQAYFQKTCSAVVQRRTQLAAKLALIGFDVLPSSANFVFAKHAQSSGSALALALREQAIAVRNFSGARTSDYLRITIGSDDELDRLLAVLTEIV
jgi:histidinol-phosphate aminotransferase